MKSSEMIWWCPTALRGSVMRGPVPHHICPMAVVVTPTTREALDPMALGTCRYCQEPLPETA